MANILDRLGQHRNELAVKRARVLVGRIAAVDGDHVVVLARLAVLQEFFARSLGEFLAVISLISRCVLFGRSVSHLQREKRRELLPFWPGMRNVANQQGGL